MFLDMANPDSGCKTDHDYAVGVVENIIANYEPNMIELNIGILFRSHGKKKGGVQILASIRKCDDLLEFFARSYFGFLPDVVIDVDLDEWRLMDYHQHSALLHHELKHIVFKWDKNNDEIKRVANTNRLDFYLTLHDIEEFKIIEELYGKDWQR